jgi:hypothetical protein
MIKEIGISRRNGSISRYTFPPKLNQEDIDHLNRSITYNEIEEAIVSKKEKSRT